MDNDLGMRPRTSVVALPEPDMRTLASSRADRGGSGGYSGEHYLAKVGSAA